MKSHSIMGGKVRLYRRGDGDSWHCSARFDGKEWRKSTKQASLALAKEVAEDWFLDLTARKRAGQLNSGPTFKMAANRFEQEYEAVTQGHRSPKWVQGHKDRLRLHLNPFFGKRPVCEISSGLAQEYRIFRMQAPANDNKKHDEEDKKPFKPPARNTIHNEIVTLRMVLKCAQRCGWLDAIPDLSDPYRSKSKVEHRPWFTPKEYKDLYAATRANAAEPRHPAYKWHAEQLHDYVLFMANTGLRPDEAKLLEFRDVELVNDKSTGQRILEIEVRGKRGVGYCKSMPGAVMPFKRLSKRLRADGGETRLPCSTDRLFPNEFKKMFNTLLETKNLKYDRHGKPRTAYSLRHSYICFRLLEGADIYQVAKNCRTSVEMIEKHYAAHIKDTINSAAINVRRATKPRASR